MKAIIKKHSPKIVLDSLLSINAAMERLSDFYIDYRRYSKHSMSSEESRIGLSDENIESQITRDFHRIEKGLSLKSPKRPFGAALIRRLEALIPEAEKRMPDANFVLDAKRALNALKQWNSFGVIDDDIAPKGTYLDEKESIFYTRHSVRNFDGSEVDEGIIDEAIRRAKFSPSVCNRQPWKLKVFKGAEAQKILKYQNGNSGFGENVNNVALIYVGLGNFVGAHERNQAWIEGGIFSSTFMWGLHSLGISSCMLNLSLRNSSMDKLRNASGLNDSDLPIMLIAFGYPEDEYRYAKSPRKDLKQIKAE